MKRANKLDKRGQEGEESEIEFAGNQKRPKKEMRDIIYAHQNRISTYNLFRLDRRREYDRNRRAALRSRQTESERQESMSTRNEQCRLRRLAESPDERDAR